MSWKASKGFIAKWTASKSAVGWAVMVAVVVVVLVMASVIVSVALIREYSVRVAGGWWRDAHIQNSIPRGSRSSVTKERRNHAISTRTTRYTMLTVFAGVAVGI